MLGGDTTQRPQLQQRFKEAGGDRMSLSDDPVAERGLQTPRTPNRAASEGGGRAYSTELRERVVAAVEGGISQ